MNASHTQLTRRQLLAAAAGATGAAWWPGRSAAQQADDGRILVILELSGGNDGLNTVVPYGDDAYYRARPTLGIRKDSLRVIDDHYGFSPGMAGFERLYKDGHMAIVHGAGYAGPSFSHFTSMAYWHTAAPNSGAEHGWVGALADHMAPAGDANFVVNIAQTQSLAVRSARHVPVVFDDPRDFSRKGARSAAPALAYVPDRSAATTPAHRYLASLARSARDASTLVRDAWQRYTPRADYGLAPLGLPRIASLVNARLPTRLYYTAYRNNVFDTHVFQANLHGRLLTYVADAVAAFFEDLEAIGRADDVTLLVFSEFGRRVAENSNLGTDHGTANNMFVVGRGVRGGHYGERPSLTALDDTDNLVHTTDFRRVYATVMHGWLGVEDVSAVLGGAFEPLPIFA